jgi:hypothetical protein
MNVTHKWDERTVLGLPLANFRQLTRVTSPVSCLVGFFPAMFSLYQSLPQKEEAEKELQTTCHDRFCIHQHNLTGSFRRRKLGTGRRACSFSEINTPSPATVKSGLRRQRSASTEETNYLDLSKPQMVCVSGDRATIPVQRFDSLAKLFSCVTLSQSGACCSHLRRLKQ